MTINDTVNLKTLREFAAQVLVLYTPNANLLLQDSNFLQVLDSFAHAESASTSPLRGTSRRGARQKARCKKPRRRVLQSSRIETTAGASIRRSKRCLTTRGRAKTRQQPRTPLDFPQRRNSLPPTARSTPRYRAKSLKPTSSPQLHNRANLGSTRDAKTRKPAMPPRAIGMHDRTGRQLQKNSVAQFESMNFDPRRAEGSASALDTLYHLQRKHNRGSVNEAHACCASTPLQLGTTLRRQQHGSNASAKSAKKPSTRSRVGQALRPAASDRRNSENR